MSRIGSYGASQMYLSRLTEIQTRLNKTQLQVATELKSTNYTGLGTDTNQLINLQNEKSRAEKFLSDNNVATTRLNAADVSMTAIEKEMKDFNQRLVNYQQFKSKDPTNIKQLQEFAFQSMVNLQAYLSANIDGQYIFSGGRVANEPVQLPAEKFEDFQNMFDGADHIYPTTRAASLQELHTDNANTGNFTINTTNGTIAAANAGTLSQVKAGSYVTVGGAGNNAGKNFTVSAVDAAGTTVRVSKLIPSAGENGVSISVFEKAGISPAEYGLVNFTADDVITFTAPNTFDQTQFAVGTVFSVSGSASVVDIDGVSKTNDGQYEVSAISAGPPFKITVKSTKLATEGGPVAATLDSASWYRGDNIQLQQHVDANRKVDLGIYASAPVFDKAFRAMALIAQGQPGTAGGLENNMERLEQARQLIQDAISRTTTGNGPFGVEETGDIDQLRGQVGTSLSLIKNTSDKHKAYTGFLAIRISDMATVDKTEAVARLLDDQTALEASYKALATVRDLSLLNYMK